MFDWSSFLSGLVGALLGGAIAVASLLMSRGDARQRRIEGEIIEVSRSIERLSGALISKGTLDFNDAVHTDITEACSAALASAMRLQLQLKTGDWPVTQWLHAKILHTIVDVPSNSLTASSAMLVPLVGWYRKEVTTAWFEAEAANVSLQSDAIATKRGATSTPPKAD